MKKITTAIIVISLLLGACQGKGERVGAVCNDGWNSTATGRGACSHHGGVDHWVHKND